MNLATRIVLLLLVALIPACADRSREAPGQKAALADDQDAAAGTRDVTPPPGDSAGMPPHTPAVDDPLTFDDAVPILTVLSEWSIRLSRDTVRKGDYAFMLQNRTVRPHVLEVRGDNGMRWRSLPLPPGTHARLALPLGPGTYSVASTDTTYARRGMFTALVVTGR
jgi:hypothetical protein